MIRRQQELDLGPSVPPGRRLLSDLGAPLWCHVLRALLAAICAKRLCGRVFAVVNHIVGFLAGRNAHDADSVADHAAGRFWPLGPLGNVVVLHSTLKTIQFGQSAVAGVDAEFGVPRFEFASLFTACLLTTSRKSSLISDPTISP